MEPAPSYDIPLETLKQGVHRFDYALDDGFFAAFGTDLIERGAFTAQVEIERVRSQFNLAIRYAGAAGVDCHRCLAPFELPLRGEEDVVIKFESGEAPRDDQDDVVYVPFGTETFNVARLLFEVIGASLPMAMTHDAAELACDPEMLKYLNATNAEEAPAGTSDRDGEIPADSPWAALRAFKGQQNS